MRKHTGVNIHRQLSQYLVVTLICYPIHYRLKS